MNSNAEQLESKKSLEIIAFNLRNKLINAKEVARIFRITESDVIKLTKKNSLPYVKENGIYSFFILDVFLWVNKNFNLNKRVYKVQV